jgi:hypothetical protein
MSIAVLYIATGPYSVFWSDFYITSEKYFIPPLKKHYFVFTDDDSIISSENVSKIFKNSEGFPKDSLFRFRMFESINGDLMNFNYVFFFNSNMIFKEEIGTDFLPKDNDVDKGLIGILHPGHANRSFFWYPYDRNRKSTAFIPFNKKESYRYFMGGVNGGVLNRYLELIEICSKSIDEDLRNNYIARYHDESHLNHYFHYRGCKVLGPEFGWVEGRSSVNTIYLEIRNKVNYGLNFKKQSNNLLIRFLNFVKHSFETILWIVR